jgi:hypothetical protein
MSKRSMDGCSCRARIPVEMLIDIKKTRGAKPVLGSDTRRTDSCCRAGERSHGAEKQDLFEMSVDGNSKNIELISEIQG